MKMRSSGIMICIYFIRLIYDETIFLFYDISNNSLYNQSSYILKAPNFDIVITNVTCTFQLYSAKRFVEGYHIHIRDMSSKDPHFDVVTLSGGGTRSHTLSDLRPDTKYSIFLLPYYEQITGNPSNLKTVTTKEDGKKIYSMISIKIILDLKLCLTGV